MTVRDPAPGLAGAGRRRRCHYGGILPWCTKRSRKIGAWRNFGAEKRVSRDWCRFPVKWAAGPVLPVCPMVTERIAARPARGLPRRISASRTFRCRKQHLKFRGAINLRDNFPVRPRGWGGGVRMAHAGPARHRAGARAGGGRPAAQADRKSRVGALCGGYWVR
jgi:hypothetical protein